jgi:hypothetical protein
VDKELLQEKATSCEAGELQAITKILEPTMGVLKHKKPLSLIVVVTVYKENHHQINFLRSPLENLYKALTSTEPPRLKFKTVSLVRPPKITTPSPISKLSSIKPTCIDSLEKLQKT